MLESRARERIAAMEGIRKFVEEGFIGRGDSELYRPAWEAVWPEAKGTTN